MNKTRNTITYLQRCIEYRAAGHMVSYTTDPKWLVNMAINRRAGWPDDPSHSRGSARPINGKYPKKASGDAYRRLCNLSRDINTRRLIVRESCLGEWKKMLTARLPQRFYSQHDF